MKMLKKVLAIALSALLLLSLCACGKQVENTDETTNAKPVTGTLHLLADAQLILGYDDEGNAVSVKGANPEGVTLAENFADVAGQATAKVVSDLVKAMVASEMTYKHILIKQLSGSAIPNKNFLEGITTEAKLAAGNTPVVVATSADLGDYDQITEDIAKELLLAYLGNPEGGEIAVSDAMDGGNFIIGFDGTDYAVNADNGFVDRYIEGGPTNNEVVTDDTVVDDTTSVPDENVSQDPVEEEYVFVEDPTEESA